MCLTCLVVLQGKFYLIIEELSQLFRSLVPIQVWYKYIMGDDPSSSYFLGGILIIMYSLCKVSSTPERPWQLWQEQGEQQLKGQTHLLAVAVPAREAAAGHFGILLPSMWALLG